MPKRCKLLILLLLTVFSLSSLYVNPLPPAQAITLEDTMIFYSTSSDGDIVKADSNYTVAWSALEGTSGSTCDYTIIGQLWVGDYMIYRSFIFFDTSSIPNSVEITNATLSLKGKDKELDVEFNITIQSGQPTYPHDPMQVGDFYKGHYSGSGGVPLNSTNWQLEQYNNITLNTQGISWINKIGTTKLCLRSHREIAGTELGVGDQEWVSLYTAEKGEANAPKLYVTYEVEGYNYLVHGPYYESGAVAPVNVSLRLEIENAPPENYTLDGGGGADTLNITLTERSVAFIWNITDPLYNQTRTYYLTDAFFEEIWIYIPHPDDPCYLYTFTVTDFIGVSNGYLETVKNVGGQNRIVERQRLDVVGSIPFWMVWTNRYDIRLVCDQGTYSWGGFIALTETSQNLIITVGMLDIEYPGLNVTVNAYRHNATWIQVTYVDNALLTSWVYIDIQYKEGFNWVSALDTPYNETGSTHTFNWYNAEADTDYIAKVTAYHDGTQKTWSFSCPHPPTEENPWEGLFESLGNWPFPPQYLIGLALVLMVFGVFSYANMPLGCILGVITAAFLNLIGWLDISWSLIALAFAVAIFAAIAKAKREEREI